MYTVRSPFFLKWYYNRSIWRGNKAKKELHLTFDDGPIPEITPFILDVLKEKGVCATFFCVGENISKHPAIFQRIKDEGHAVGNHTHNHLNGWNTTDIAYLENIATCQHYTQSNLFRPPYGRAKKRQLKEISQDYKIIMWDVLSGDFDLNLRPEKCLENVLRYSRNGSIIVFHDNIKAIDRVQYALPKAIDQLKKKGYKFVLFDQ